MSQREQELLPVPYFHVVFTIPHELGPVAMQNKRIVYGILFRAAAQTLREIPSTWALRKPRTSGQNERPGNNYKGLPPSLPGSTFPLKELAEIHPEMCGKRGGRIQTETLFQPDLE
jgi:hypothetical protein